MIQERFNRLKPYIKGLEVTEKYNVVKSSLKRTWKIPDNNEIGSEKTANGQIFYSLTMTLDELLDWLEYDVIKYNLEIEEKDKLLSDKVAELKKVFEDNSLEDLVKLTFNTDKITTTPSNKNKKEKLEDGNTKELSPTN